MNMHYGLALVFVADARLAFLCEEALRSAGFLVETYHDGKAAYDRLAVEPAPRLVLVDLQLPTVSGYEITWEMWFNPTGSKIIVIASDDETAAVYRGKAGVERVVIKPFTREDLFKIVRPFINPAYKG